MIRLPFVIGSFVLLSIDTCSASHAIGPPATPGGAFSAGVDHTCSVTAVGGVACWGFDERGQLGDGRVGVVSTSPVAAAGVTGAVAVAAGGAHTCVLRDDGSVECWGANDFGQLGDGTATDRATPAPVLGAPPHVVAITAGDTHTCALTADGAVWCWGDDADGQLGVEGGRSSTPVPMRALPDRVTQIAAGGTFTCALTAGGAVWCVGDDYWGTLGDGSWVDSSIPVAVVGLSSGVVAIDAGEIQTCALTADDRVLCWGANLHHQLGTAATADRSTLPVAITGLASGITAIAVGNEHACAISTGGRVQCWGQNDAGELGAGAPPLTAMPPLASAVPVDARGLPPDLVALSAGGGDTVAMGFTCARTSAGSVWCWGQDFDGQLGRGISERTGDPAPVVGL